MTFRGVLWQRGFGRFVAGAFVVSACGQVADRTTGGGGGSASGGAPGSGAMPSSGGSPGSGAMPSSGGTAGSGGRPSAGCVGACCPTSATCYSSSSGPTSPGAECLARHQNPNPLSKPVLGHITMRQSWIRNMDSFLSTGSLIYQSYQNRTSLPQEAACNTPEGASGFMQISDMDLTDPDPAKHTFTVGHAAFVENTADTIANGACFGSIGAPGWTQKAPFPTETSPVTDFSLLDAEMSDSSAYPRGLPKPQGQKSKPWTAGPSRAVRVWQDFNLQTERAALLESLDEGGSRAGYDGVFYLDEAKGEIHGYSPLTWQILYDGPRSGETSASGFLIPFREVELKFKTNDPAAPNCIGRYRTDFLTQDTDCTAPYPYTPAWGGIFNTIEGESDAEMTGYHLITELEQVYSRVLGSTICVSYPGAATSIAAGWGTDADKRCRSSSQWNPSAPDNTGIPTGNWCAATNSPATKTCHDAHRNRSFHAFQAFKVKAQTCPVAWAL